MVSSSIISFSEAYQLKSLCNFSSDLNFKLLYQGDRDGFNKNSFRSKVNDESNLFIIIKTTRGNIFGGFTSQKFMFDRDDALSYFWRERVYNYQYDENAFLFSFKNSKNNSVRINIDHPEYAIRDIYLNEGPSFGSDLSTYFDPNNNIMYGYSYYSFKDSFSSFLTNEMVSNSQYGYYFVVSNIEIYKIDCKL